MKETNFKETKRFKKCAFSCRDFKGNPECRGLKSPFCLQDYECPFFQTVNERQKRDKKYKFFDESRGQK